MSRPIRVRLDQLVVERGLAGSRERARALILAGRVLVESAPIDKAGARVDRNATLRLIQPDHPYVGRGGVKLAHALADFGITVAGRVALDIGASTGGFTDVLLRHGARTVVALDVGHGQLDWSLRRDSRVLVLERLNARFLNRTHLPPDLLHIDIVTVDVSFISLRHIVPVLPPLLAADADVIALVKPQFEAGRTEVGRGGIVRDPEVQARVLSEVATTANRVGLTRVGTVAAAITGREGNQEFLMHLRLGDRSVRGGTGGRDVT